MAKSLVVLLVLAVIVTGCDEPGQQAEGLAQPAAVADVLYTNGRIYTVDKSRPWAEAVAIRDGKFVAVGTAAEVQTLAGDSTEVIDLGGAFAMPGIGDSHIHPALVMPKRAFCGLPGTFYEPTEKQIVDALKDCVANYPEDRQ